jgi:hypothetical protein
MKRFFWMSLFGVGAAVLGGCPIYPDDGSQRVCSGNGCYACNDPYYTSNCTPYQCYADTDCPSNYACVNAQCVANGTRDAGGPSTCAQPGDCAAGENCGKDGYCHAGDCSNSGCPNGYQCILSGGMLQCVGSAVHGDGGGVIHDGSADSGFTGCHNDTECASSGAGAKCLDGTCVKPQDQCFDGTQCPPNDQCVAGVCTPTCGPTADGGAQQCPIGYSCDSKGVCTGNPNPCGSTGEMCATGTVCVDTHCVPPCAVGNTCPTGDVCVAGGCIPDQKPRFVCGADGTPGDGMPGNCAVGSICLHHSCYIACTMSDAGDAGNGCRAADNFNVCKAVSASGTTYDVCGSATNLGSQCDPTQGIACDAGVCIDGYCR